MKINNLGLSAFYEAALKLHMTEAAGILGITQSALSQRIKGLEDDLETTLFVREGKSLSLTEAGVELLQYCQGQVSLEEELLSKLRGEKDTIGGSLRIAAFSSILRSVIIPKLAPFLRKHPTVSVIFSSHEMSTLYDVLKTGEADLVITDFSMARKGIIEKVIGQEDYVVIESVKHRNHVPDVYLDHGPSDNATESYFAHQQHRPVYRRSFMGDVYGIIDGVEQGLGRAVMSKHLIEDNKKIRQVPGFKKYQRPVTLHYFEKPFYPKLLREVIALLIS